MVVYVDGNPLTKSLLRQRVASGKSVTVYQCDEMTAYRSVPDGTHAAQGPQYPKAHAWYATVKVQGGKVVSVK